MSPKNLVGTFNQLAASDVAEHLGISAHDFIENFALNETFKVLFPEFKKDAENPFAAREEIVKFLYEHTSGRYQIYQTLAPQEFPDHPKNRRDAMTLALIGDACVAYMNPHQIPDGCDKDLIILSYEIFRQADEWMTYGFVEGPVIPESRFLAQVDGIDMLDYFESYLMSYSRKELAEHVHSTLQPLSELADTDTASGQALYNRLTDIIGKVEEREKAFPQFTIV